MPARGEGVAPGRPTSIRARQWPLAAQSLSASLVWPLGGTLVHAIEGPEAKRTPTSARISQPYFLSAL